MHRRGFLKAIGAISISARIAAQERQIPYGEHPIGLSDSGRDGTIYVPKSYKDGTPMPLVVMLHGLSGGAERVRYMQPFADEFGLLVLAPEARDRTWGQSNPGFDEDVHYIRAAFDKVTSFFDVDGERVALGGVSDGASYALAMGLAYGDTFNHLMIFAGAFIQPLRRRGKPRLFVGHGTNDRQMPIDRTARKFVPQLKEEG
jgi:phospholipase/carboxylesterase